MIERNRPRYPTRFAAFPHEKSVNASLEQSEEDIRRYVESSIDDTSAIARGRVSTMLRSFQQSPKLWWWIGTALAVTASWTLVRFITSEE
jgi:hypothetical protein